MADAPSLRDTIAAAVDTIAESAPEPVEQETTAPEAVEAAPEAAPEQTAAERARDEQGRFAPKPKDGAKEAAKAVGEAPAGAEKAAKPETASPVEAKAGGEPTKPPLASPDADKPQRVPQSFRPAARELAQKLPAEFRPLLDEAVRIDNEAKRALNDSAEARKIVARVSQTLQPYEAIARANGMDSMAFAGNVLQTAAALQMGTPQQKAQTVAQVIKMYGVDIESLAAALDGTAAPVSQQAQQPVNVEAVVERVLQQQLGQANEQRAMKSLEEFQATNPEFLSDVMPDMEVVIRTAAARGEPITWQQAYDRACRMNDGVAEVLSQRRTVDAAKARAPAVQRSKAAAVSIKSIPGGEVRAGGASSLRETIEAAVAAQRT